MTIICYLCIPIAGETFMVDLITSPTLNGNLLHLNSHALIKGLIHEWSHYFYSFCFIGCDSACFKLKESFDWTEDVFIKLTIRIFTLPDITGCL